MANTSNSNVNSEESISMRNILLSKLMLSDRLRYSDLHRAFDNHDLFNYHLRELVSKGFVKKEKNTYSLTENGKQFVATMEEDGKIQKQFKVGMWIDVIRKYKGNFQMLLHRRL